MIKDSLKSILIKAGSALFSFLSGLLLARALDAENFGIYSFSLAIISVVVIPTTLGLPNLLVRFISNYGNNEQWGKVKGLFLRTHQLLLFSISIVLVTLFLYLYLFAGYDFKYRSTLIWGFFLIPLLSLLGAYGGILRGLKSITQGIASEGLIRNFILTLFVGLVILTKKNLTAHLGMLLHVIAAGLTLFITIYWVYKKVKNKIFNVSVKYDTKLWLSVSIPFLLTGGLGVLKYRTDIIILGIMTDPTQVGVYEVAVKGSTLIAFALIAVNQAIGPYFSSLYSSNRFEELQELVTKSARLIFIFTLPVITIFVAYSELLLVTLFGNEYSNGNVSLIILSIGQLFNVLMGSVGLLLIMTDYEKDMLYGLLFGTLLNIILNIMLIPYYGIEGAATASAVSMIVQNIILAVFVKIRLRMNSTVLGFI